MARYVIPIDNNFKGNLDTKCHPACPEPQVKELKGSRNPAVY